MSENITKIVSDVSIKLMDTQDHLKALSLIVKYQNHYLEDRSQYIPDIKESAVSFKEDNEIMMRFLGASLDDLYSDLSTKNQILLDL